jgi:protein involved in polysaccharide export with SLBB domain
MMPKLSALIVACIAFMLSACAGGGGLPAATPVAANAPYTLAAGDRLRIIVYGEETLTGEYRVTGEGNVSFPLIGNIKVDGRTVEDLQADLTRRLGNGYLADPRVSAEIIDFRPYYILGEVTRPGEYQYSVGLTMQQAIAAAGGFTYRAKNNRVFLKRATETRETLVDLKKNPAFLVRPGDTIRIGERFF